LYPLRENYLRKYASEIPRKFPTAYPIIPIVIPDRITSLFFNAFATVGTNGAEKMNAVEAIMVVSVSILKSFENNI